MRVGTAHVHSDVIGWLLLGRRECRACVDHVERIGAVAKAQLRAAERWDGINAAGSGERPLHGQGARVQGDELAWRFVMVVRRPTVRCQHRSAR